MAVHFAKWETVKEEIETLYNQKDKRAVELMNGAINDYTELLAYGGEELNQQSGRVTPVLLPLNGHERFNFIKERIHSHYAFIQLDALYEETRKKAARLSIMRK